MKRFSLAVYATFLVLLAAGCERGEKVSTALPEEPSSLKSNAIAATSAGSPSGLLTNTAPAIGSGDVGIISTTSGDMVVEFWPDVAPSTVENFKKLAREKFYDGTAFHRIMKNFMIQGGDPLTKDPSAASRYGSGGPGYTINAEFNSRKHVRGVLSMARSGDPNSAGSQFFICLAPQPGLDNQYTGFGRVIKGDEVLERIGNTPVTTNPASGEPSVPLTRVEIKTVSIVPASEIK